MKCILEEKFCPSPCMYQSIYCKRIQAQLDGQRSFDRVEWWLATFLGSRTTNFTPILFLSR